jgi:hypothetical protein
MARSVPSGKRGIAARARIEPDLVAAGSLAIEFEAQRFQPPRNIAIAVSAQSSHV